MENFLVLELQRRERAVKQDPVQPGLSGQAGQNAHNPVVEGQELKLGNVQAEGITKDVLEKVK